jgi:Icc-related predicted phosphoesterase
MSQIITILALPDLHGKIPTQLLNITSQIDAIISPGDICLDTIKNTTYKEFEKKSIEGGEKVLEFLSSFNKPIYIVPGNWDPTKYCDGIKRERDDKFNKMLTKFPLVHNCEYNTLTINNTNISIIGAGSTSAPEIISRVELHKKIKYEENEEEIEELQNRYLYQKRRYEIIDEAFERLHLDTNKHSSVKIFLSHNSPYNTPLDIIKNPFNPLNNQHYGSLLARAIIEKHQPHLVISGHIHEGVGICKIHNSLCLNTGFGNTIYHLITIDTNSKKILTIKKYGRNQA